MRREALVVGINQYPGLRETPTSPAHHLTTPAAGAEAIARLLEADDNFKVRRLPASINRGSLQVDPEKRVNTEELENAIADLFLPNSQRVPQTALLFFSGHGLRKQLRESLTQGFLATSDVSPQKSLWGMSLRDLWDILQASQVQQQIVWLDCCFAGELLNFKETELGRQSSGRDRFLIAASRDSEVAYQHVDGRHGALTAALLAGLNRERTLESEWITDQMLALSVQQYLCRYYESAKFPQSPLIDNHGEAIKLVRGNAKIAPESPADIPLQLLFHELLNADFKHQIPVVKRTLQKRKTAAFLIHGEPYCGQQLLTTRLSRLNPKWNNISPIKVDVGQRAVGGRISYLWQHLTPWFGLPKDSEPARILERICDRLTSQDLIFIFDRANDMPPTILVNWLQDFWQPLVTRVEEYCPSQQRETHLLMFLVDNKGSLGQSELCWGREDDEPPFPLMPLNLPPNQPFAIEVLEELIERVATIPKLSIPLELTSQTLFEKSDNGIPEFVYEEICTFCGQSWEGGLAKWLI